LAEGTEIDPPSTTPDPSSQQVQPFTGSIVLENSVFRRQSFFREG
jgi:hypothetical protein